MIDGDCPKGKVVTEKKKIYWEKGHLRKLQRDYLKEKNVCPEHERRQTPARGPKNKAICCAPKTIADRRGGSAFKKKGETGSFLLGMRGGKESASFG